MSDQTPDTGDNPRETIAAALDGLLTASAPRRLCFAYGSSPPAKGATISRSPRLVLTLSGRNGMEIPVGPDTTVVTTGTGEATFVDARAWNRPLFTGRYRFLTIDWKADYIRFYLRQHLRSGSTEGTAWTHMRNGAPSAASLALLRCLHELPRQGALDVARDTVAALLRLSRRELAAEAESVAKEDRWRMMRDWIEEHCAEPLDRLTVAKRWGMHPNHVSRLFSRHAGESFSAWLNRRRLDRAADLLTRYGLGVGEAARRAGFSSAEYFANCFRRRFGKPPSRYAAGAAVR